MDERSPDGTSPPRPMSVRESLGKDEHDPDLREHPERRVDRGEESWIVRSAGVTRSGTGADAGARLLFLTFADAAEPDTPLREALVPAASLEELSHEALEGALERSRPVSK